MKLSIKNLGLLLLVIFFTFQLSAQDKKEKKKYQVAIVAFYNLENFYDTLNDPIKNDDEFTPEGKNKWTGERYKIKLHNMASAISRIGEGTTKGGPVILGCSEVENASVLQDLINTEPLKSLDYGYVHYDCRDRRGVDVAFLYQKKRFKVLGSKPFPLITADTSLYTRDQLLVHGLLDGEEVYVLVNHWPSRGGGQKASAPKRNAAAQLARTIADSLMNANPDVKMLIMGDLNDDPIDASLTQYLKAKAKVEEVKKGDLYNPMYKLFQDGVGSLAYQDAWNLFDQIIVTSSLVGKDFSSYRVFGARVFNEEFLKQKTGAFAGYPWRTYAGGQFTAGYSDHFPSYLILAREVK